MRSINYFHFSLKASILACFVLNTWIEQRIYLFHETKIISLQIQESMITGGVLLLEWDG